MSQYSVMNPPLPQPRTLSQQQQQQQQQQANNSNVNNHNLTAPSNLRSSISNPNLSISFTQARPGTANPTNYSANPTNYSANSNHLSALPPRCSSASPLPVSPTFSSSAQSQYSFNPSSTSSSNGTGGGLKKSMSSGGLSRTASFSDLSRTDSGNSRQADTILHSINHCSETPLSRPYPLLNSKPKDQYDSSQTVYGAPSSRNLLGARTSPSPPPTTLPQWGPPIYSRPAPTAPAGSIASLYAKPAPPTIPFAPSPRPPQNIADNDTFFELYKSVWANWHPVHDGIERPAVQSLLPPQFYWFGKKILDIGCGSGKLCRQFRSAHAQCVIGVDSSSKMLAAASARELADQADHGPVEDGISDKFKRFFRTTPNEGEESKSLTKESASFFKKLKDGIKLKSSHDSHRDHDPIHRRPSPSPEPSIAPPSRNGSISSSTSTSSFSPPVIDESVIDMKKKVFTPEEAREIYRRDRPSNDILAKLPFNPVEYVHTSIEDWDVSSMYGSFHLITCCMTMQFIWDLQAFSRKLYSLLAPNGLFVCSVDHPVSTCSWGIHPLVVKNHERDPEKITYFPIDQYHEQGERKAKYYVDGVVKYHRRLDTYINTFLSAGLVLEKLVEPRASPEMEEKHPELKTWRRRPIFLCMRFRKPIKNDGW